MTTCKCAHTVVEKLASGQFRYVVSDESFDCENEKILLSAWTKLGKFPVHVNHDRSRQVGSATVFARGGQLLADVSIDDPTVRAQIEDGSLARASVGFTRDQSYKLADGGLVTTRATLHEISVVPMGCNVAAARVKTQQTAPPPSPTLTAEQMKELARAGVEKSFLEIVQRETGLLDRHAVEKKMREDAGFAAAIATSWTAISQRLGQP